MPAGMTPGGPAKALGFPSSAKQNKQAMKVFLRKTGTIEYYKGRNEWTREMNEAHDFRTSVEAVWMTSSQGLGGCEVVLSFGNPGYDLVLPVADGANGAPRVLNGAPRVDGQPGASKGRTSTNDLGK